LTKPVPDRDARSETVLEEPDVARLIAARLHDPFRVLGRHRLADGRLLVRAFLPSVRWAEIVEADERMVRLPDTDLFEWVGDELPDRYRLRCQSTSGEITEAFDPYSFPTQLEMSDLEAFRRGEHTRAHRFMGAHLAQCDGVDGVRFAVWAPNAERVSVVGDFNDWDGRRHPLRVRADFGIWELFIPGLVAGHLYKYEIRNAAAGTLHLKTDPFGRLFEHRPSTASVVAGSSSHRWTDKVWIAERESHDWLHEPMSIYELHCGSWRRAAGGGFENYRALADALADYVSAHGFTHVELMPITEYPLDESWGYQTTGYFAPTTRYGSPDELKYLVNCLHERDIGVILDWVPGHFPRDEHGLARFDGTPLFEYGDTRKGEHADWGTLIFNYSRDEVRSFLISSAVFWLEDFHFDGLRVDAVASMLYLDYSRGEGEWSPNVYGGNENLEAIAFLRRLNEVTHGEVPGTLTIAEESTAWPAVTRPTYTGGLGFSLKWNMGWMHDTLQYFRKDPVHRKYHQDLLTFGPVYAFSENFILPFSHDEVVHRKGSLLGRMPGDHWQRFANLRLAYTYQWTFPGKKLLFMGSEFAQPSEWNHNEALPWHLLNEPAHAGIAQLIQDLNRLYRQRGALHYHDFDAFGFEWLRWDDAENGVLSYIRRGDDTALYILLNLTPVPRIDYRIGVPHAGTLREIFNSDSRHYGGSDLGNPLPIETDELPWMDRPGSITVTVPPLAGIVLEMSAQRR
jgi:1,4-alpha-glucan branching enzyme